MAQANKFGKSVADWQPSAPTKENSSLMEPNAKDNPDSLSPTNDLKRTTGGKGTPPKPYGRKGFEF